MIIFTTCHCTRDSEDIGSIVRMVRWTLTWTMEIACRQSRQRGFQTKNEIYIFLFCYQIIIGWNISVFEWSWRVNIVKLKDWRTVRNLFSSKWGIDFVSFKFIASKITFFGCNFTKNRPELLVQILDSRSQRNDSKLMISSQSFWIRFRYSTGRWISFPRIATSNFLPWSQISSVFGKGRWFNPSTNGEMSDSVLYLATVTWHWVNAWNRRYWRI